MIFSLAPMEGLTGSVFRRVHAECFDALDRYYTPFLTPPHVGSSFGKKGWEEIDPEVNRGLNVIPQLLTKDADQFVWASQVLKDLGYTEVNLNLGCPSGTVVAKGRGSGALRDVDWLKGFLQDICARSALPVSVKTRLGIADDAEYQQIERVYAELPLAELIVHPRLQKDRYQGHPRQEAYGRSLRGLAFPVAYNGDIFAPDDLSELTRSYPATQHVMLGRGLLTNPALVRQVKGGMPATDWELRQFHDKLYREYLAQMGGNAVFRMKEWWFYAKCAFADSPAVHRAVRKVKKVEEYEDAVAKIFSTQPLAREARFTPPV